MKRKSAILLSWISVLILLIVVVGSIWRHISNRAIGSCVKEKDDIEADGFRQITMDAYIEERKKQQSIESRGSWTEDELLAFELLMDSIKDMDGDFTDAELEGLCAPGEPRSVGKEDAIQDASTFFRLIREAYGAYWYFGGDKAFCQAEDAVIRALSSFADGAVISSALLGDLIARTLQPILSDNHFAVGGNRVAAQCRSCWVPDVYVDYEIAGLEGYMAQTITPEGYIKWGFFAATDDFGSLPEYALICDETVALTWAPMDTAALQPPPYYSVSYIKGIPVISARSFMPDIAEQYGVDVFEKSGALVKENETVILDLRGNTGGNGTYALNWLEHFINELNVKAFTAQRVSKPLLAYVKSPESQYSEEYIEWFETQKNQWISDYQDGSMSRNSCNIFVVVDSNVASSAEDLVFWLQHVENVFLVGTNTQGTSICGNICNFYLPNSKLAIQFGTKLNVYGSLVRSDGHGFEPDLWVEPICAIDRIVLALSAVDS